MPELVVDLFEVVQVKNAQTHGYFQPSAQFQLTPQHVIALVPVEQAGEFVGPGQAVVWVNILAQGGIAFLQLEVLDLQSLRCQSGQLKHANICLRNRAEHLV